MKKILILVCVCFLGAISGADELTVFAYPAPIQLDWNSPAGLAWTTVLNQLVVDPQLIAIHSIGHMNFQLHCDPSSSLVKGADFEIGQTSSNDSQMNNDLLKSNYGLGILINNYSGEWENKADIEKDLQVRYERGTVAYLNFKIRASTCARVVHYLNEYKARGLDQIYSGLEDQARQGHGSGCSSFAASVLEIAGLMTPEWSAAWTQTRNIPTDLIGGPTTGNQVSLGELMLMPIARDWAPNSKNAFTIHFWDPFLAYSWVQQAYQQKLKLTGMNYVTSSRQNALGVEIDASKIATPTDSFWQN